MSFWPPPPSGSPPPMHGATTTSPQHEQQQRSEPYRSPSQTYASGDHARLYDGSLFPHAEPPSHHDSAFEWQPRQQQYSLAPVDPRVMAISTNLDPLPIEDSSCSELRRASVSLEDEIFEARMLQEALRDCDTMPASMVHAAYHDAADEVKLADPGTDSHFHYHQQRHHLHDHGHRQHQSPSPPPPPPPPSLFQAQPFHTQLLHSPAFATVTPPNSALPRGAISQRDPSIHVVSPVETLRSFMLNNSQPMISTSPSSYSSSSSSGRSPVMGLAHLSGATPPSSGATPQAQPKKRVQQARICHVEGCTRGIRSRGLCKAHGGGRRCTTPGCTTSDQGGGHCVLHGGGRRCRVEGCMKSAQWRGVCKLHGGARRCRFGNCTKNGQVKQGYCRLHYNALMQQRQQQNQLSLQAQGQEGELKLTQDGGAESEFSAEVMQHAQQQLL